MHEMTAQNLRSAFGGESMAHLRYQVWGKKAEQDGFPHVGRLFRAIAFAEEVHAAKLFKRLKDDPGASLVASAGGFGIGTTAENLRGAVEGETFEIQEMYPAYLQVAEAQGEQDAVKSFTYAYETERVHAMLYGRAQRAVEAGNDVELSVVQICDHCGWTCEGEAPDVCPLCQVKKERFVAFA